jgi:hypothetical protein
MKTLNLELLSKNIFNDILNGSQGQTYANNGNVHKETNGFFVGIFGFSVPKMYFLNPKYPILTLANQIANTFVVDNLNYIGSWVSNDVVYIDKVEWIENFDEAVKKGLENNQKAIYDIENSKDINL